MAAWLKQATAVEIALGPFLDSTDGNTAETGLTIEDEHVDLKKNGGDWGDKAETTTCVHESQGWYRCLLDTTDTNTLGILVVKSHVTGALQVWREFMVLPANIYDALVAGSDLVQVDTREVTGTAQTAGDLAALINTVDNLIDTEVAAIKTVVDAVQAKTDNLPSDPADASVVAGLIAAAEAKIDTIDGIVDSILVDTAEIGAAGAGLTAINLPNQTMDIVGNITGNLSGSVGSVTGAVGSVTGLTASDVGAIKTKTDSLTFTVAGKTDANVTAVNGDALSAAYLAKTTRVIGRGTASGGTTTSITTSAFLPAGAVADQFKGRIITFDADTTTTALRGQSTDITASSNASAPTFTVTALTTAAASGDTFSVT